MKLIIDVDLLNKEGISLKEFALLLYYKDNNNTIIDEDTSEALWNKGYLCKDVNGYKLVSVSMRRILSVATSEKYPCDERLKKLAKKLMDLVPQGKMFDGPYYYKCNQTEITRALRKFHSIYKKYDGTQYSDRDIIEATKEWVKSFDENYERMIQLKNFVCRINVYTGDITSLLASYLEDKYDKENS